MNDKETEIKCMTSIIWLFNEMNRIRLEDESESIGVIEFFELQEKALQQAKEMHKQEIINAHENEQLISQDDGSWEKITSEQYYNETFKKD